jgi:hypothetical protein
VNLITLRELQISLAILYDLSLKRKINPVCGLNCANQKASFCPAHTWLGAYLQL